MLLGLAAHRAPPVLAGCARDAVVFSAFGWLVAVQGAVLVDQLAHIFLDGQLRINAMGSWRTGAAIEVLIGLFGLRRVDTSAPPISVSQRAIRLQIFRICRHSQYTDPQRSCPLLRRPPFVVNADCAEQKLFANDEYRRFGMAEDRVVDTARRSARAGRHGAADRQRAAPGHRCASRNAFSRRRVVTGFPCARQGTSVARAATGCLVRDPMLRSRRCRWPAPEACAALLLSSPDRLRDRVLASRRSLPRSSRWCDPLIRLRSEITATGQ